MSENANPFKAVCAVCLAEFHLSGEKDHPIRHGFSTHNVRHGTSGGWHTGPCGGVGFPHFGISTEGTVWALGKARAHLDHLDAEIARLGTNPDLEWSYQATKRVSRYGTKERREPTGERVERTLRAGCASERVSLKTEHGFNSDVTVPSYEAHKASLLSNLAGSREQAADQVARYEAAIASWKPAAKVAAPSTKVVHAAHAYRKVISAARQEYGTYIGPACRHVRLHDSYKYVLGQNLTADPAEVTCLACKKSAKAG